ncbi:MAG: HET-C-related protein [Bacillota bacterium]|nr:HET-C-related protein [Bacillota bacterium]
MKKFRLLIFLLTLSAVLCLRMAVCSAYDTGNHYYLTSNSMVKLGFQPNAITHAVINNYYDDGFQSADDVIDNEIVKLLGKDSLWAAWYGPSYLRNRSKKYLHFDSWAENGVNHMLSGMNLENAWDTLLRNTHKAVKQAESENDVAGFLAVLGMTTHAVQDFYAHSNWTNVMYNDYGNRTWFEVNQSDRLAKTDLKTYTSTEQASDDKDYAGKSAYFDNSYKEAYYATLQWIDLLDNWVSPNFLNNAKTYGANYADAQKEFQLIIDMSTASGHWMGRNADRVSEPTGMPVCDFDLLKFGLMYSQNNNHHEVFLDKWKKYADIVTDPNPVDEVYPMTITIFPRENWVNIDFSRVKQTCDGWGPDTQVDFFPFIDLSDMDIIKNHTGLIKSFDDNRPDFYANIRVGGRLFRTAVEYNTDDTRPTNWSALTPIGNNLSADISMQLMDRDGDIEGDDDECDIEKAEGKKIWVGYGINGVKSFHTDGDEDDCGDGDEASCDFTVSIDQDNTLLPYSQNSKITYALPEKPTVVDEGAFTQNRTYLKASWESKTPVTNYYPIHEYQYRVRGTGYTLVDWTSAGLSTSMQIPVQLGSGEYFVDIRAKNFAGFSEIASSDGIRTDITPPQCPVITEMFQTNPEDYGFLYPNSVKMTVKSEDYGVGIEKYNIKFRDSHTGDNMYEVTLPGGDVLDTTLVDLPLKNGVYNVTVTATDKFGNTSPPYTDFVQLNLYDTTKPPCALNATAVGYSNSVLITWGNSYDPESGIFQYNVGVGDTPETATWYNGGKATSYEVKGEDLQSQKFWVKVINGFSLESISETLNNISSSNKPSTPRLIDITTPEKIEVRTPKLGDPIQREDIFNKGITNILKESIVEILKNDAIQADTRIIVNGR